MVGEPTESRVPAEFARPHQTAAATTRRFEVGTAVVGLWCGLSLWELRGGRPESLPGALPVGSAPKQCRKTPDTSSGVPLKRIYTPRHQLSRQFLENSDRFLPS